MDTNRWGRRREWEDTPIRSPAPKVLSRLWEATCQRQTSMRFLRGWMLINFMTKHVNIKGLQIQFSAAMKMPFYWLKGTGLPLWSGHQAMAVVLTARRFITTMQPANPIPRCTRWPSPKDSGQPWYLLTLTSKTPLEANTHTGQEGIAELLWFPKYITDNSPIPVFLFLLLFYSPVRTAPGRMLFFVRWFGESNFPDTSLPWAPTPSLKRAAYKLGSLQRL